MGLPWRIKRYGYFGISAAIRDHSMLPFQCFAPPSVKVVKIRWDGVSFARVATEESPAIIPQRLETGNRDVNFDTLGISPIESTEITETYDISLSFSRKCRIIFHNVTNMWKTMWNEFIWIIICIYIIIISSLCYL